MRKGTKAEMEGVLRQFVRYAEQWQRIHGPFSAQLRADGRQLILRNARKVLGIKEPR